MADRLLTCRERETTSHQEAVTKKKNCFRLRVNQTLLIESRTCFISRLLIYNHEIENQMLACFPFFYFQFWIEKRKMTLFPFFHSQNENRKSDNGSVPVFLFPTWKRKTNGRKIHGPLSFSLGFHIIHTHSLDTLCLGLFFFHPPHYI